MAQGERVALTGLEERFAGDRDRVELNKVLKELDGYLAQVKKSLDAGVAPAEFQKLSKYRAALEQAHEAATKAWALSVKL